MGINLCSIASGSSGNSIYVGSEENGLLIDCGVSGKEILNGLKNIGICTSKIKGILVTHEHSDHIKSIGIVSRKLNIPIYANAATWANMDECIGKIKAENVKLFTTGQHFEIEDITIKAYDIPHDAAEPVGFCFFADGKKASLATDLGFFSDNVRENIKGSDVILLESNHDVEMLMVGRYPYFLKRRILSDHGHLSNEAAGKAVFELVNCGAKRILLGHLSKENNFPELAYETVKSILVSKGMKIGTDLELHLAPRSDLSKYYRII